jgi:hypothetical protein
MVEITYKRIYCFNKHSNSNSPSFILEKDYCLCVSNIANIVKEIINLNKDLPLLLADITNKNNKKIIDQIMKELNKLLILYNQNSIDAKLIIFELSKRTKIN